MAEGAERPAWAPASIDMSVPSAARVWDFFLGGSHNFAVDRQVGRAAISMKADMPELAWRVRVFLRRAVNVMAAAGVDQFLDVGAGIPTVGPVHEVARAVHPDAAVVYVDHDPVAVTHGRALLADDPRATFVDGELSSPGAILRDPRVRELLDFERPIGLLLCGVLHFLPDEADPNGLMAELRDALPPGSFVALQHATVDAQPAETIRMLEMWNANSPEPMYWRTRDRIADLLAGFTLLEPGVVFLPDWRPDPDEKPEQHPERFGSYAALAAR